MALILTGTTFAGKSAEQFVSLPIAESDTLNANLLTIWEGIPNHGFVVPTFNVANQSPFQANVAEPTVDSLDFSKGEIRSVPVKFISYTRMNEETFENDWDEQTRSLKPYNSANLLHRGINPTIENWIITLTLEQQSAWWDRMIWMGRTQYATINPSTKGDTFGGGSGVTSNKFLSFFDGILKQLLNGVAIPVPSPSTVTSANVLAKLNTAIALIPRELKLKFGTMSFAASPSLIQLAIEALTNLPQKGIDPLAKGYIPTYQGYKLIPTNGITDVNTFVLGNFNSDSSIRNNSMGNFHYVCNQMSDMNNILFDRWRPETKLLFLKAEMNGIVKVGMPELVVYHTLLTN